MKPRWTVGVLVVVLAGCAGPPPASRQPSASGPVVTGSMLPTALPARTEHAGASPVAAGEPIRLATLAGRILFDDFEDLFAMDVDGSHVATLAGDPAGPEFDGAWSPDGESVAYRDSTRGINDDDEIFVVRADGSTRRNLTSDPANDWGPDWSPDGASIVFNSDRGGGPLHGYLVDVDGSNVRRLDTDAWVEYPSFSPEGTSIAFMGHDGSD